jgi:uncharacterized protein YecE (DUF72 family)
MPLWEPTQFFVGTSGYSYPKLKGSFYPEKLSQKKMLSYYADRFSTVEINYTFRAIPSEKVVRSCAQQTPDTFRFVLKAPKAITHDKRLEDVEELTDQFLNAAMVLNGQRGPLLFQLPPNFKKDLLRLESFVKLIDKRVLSAFEFLPRMPHS